MAIRNARILILCKTYPSPSTRYAETSCVAGLEENGKLVRLYPVPFRLIANNVKFKKWQWITATIEKAKKDHRPESHRIGVDTIICDDAVVSTKNEWSERRRLLAGLPVFKCFTDLEEARLSEGHTLGLLRPERILGLDITPTASDWTPEEREKLLQMQQQGNLFDKAEAASIATLQKLPFDFHYRYECVETTGAHTEIRHKIVDWEIGALYWNVRKRHGENWEAPFRKKIEQALPSLDLMFLMGTLHRFPDQWLIVSLIYPPKRQPATPNQLSLL
ncbi:MAG: hypothetical protein P4L57_11345 [Rhizomicrobium sp.]|nr:hypothetical protein [Rhizomicrobium sp.]